MERGGGGGRQQDGVSGKERRAWEGGGDINPGLTSWKAISLCLSFPSITLLAVGGNAVVVIRGTMVSRLDHDDDDYDAAAGMGHIYSTRFSRSLRCHDVS
jgi:hypothetical protein